jgi:ADP-ribose pyrophosphatase YjhB (NUDIX family)
LELTLFNRHGPRFSRPKRVEQADSGPGNTSKPVPSVGVAIIDHDGRILLGRRRDDETWCRPGGRLEPGESFADYARRECLKELGWEVELADVIAVMSNPVTQLRRYPNGFVGVV